MTSGRTQVVGLALFSVSGVIFLVAALRAGDAWTAVGSVVWLAGCAIWAVPHVGSHLRGPDDRSTRDAP